MQPYLYDQLDNYFFPTDGEFLSLSAYGSIKNDSDINQYFRVGGEFKTAHSLGNGVGLFTLKGQAYTGEAPEFLDMRWLGGFMNLSSYRYQELLTNRYLYGSVQYYQPTSLLARSYWGVGLEGARTFEQVNAIDDKEWRSSVVAYVAYDSFLGPLYLGVAYGDNRLVTGYFMLGKQF